MLHPFLTIWSAYNSVLSMSMEETVSAGLSATAGVMVAALTIYVLVCGLLFSFGQLGGGDALHRIVLACAVSTALTPTFFNEYVMQFFAATLPDWINQAIGGRNLGHGAAQFDSLLSTVMHMAAAIELQSVGFSYAAERFQVELATSIAEFFLFASFLTWVAAQMLVSVLVCIGPFILPALLFQPTRYVARNWMLTLVGLTILYLLVAVLLQIVIAQDRALLANLVTAPAIGVPEEIEVLWEAVLVLGFGAAMLVMLPSVAVYLGGGVSFAPTKIIGHALRVMRGIL